MGLGAFGLRAFSLLWAALFVGMAFSGCGAKEADGSAAAVGTGPTKPTGTTGGPGGNESGNQTEENETRPPDNRGSPFVLKYRLPELDPPKTFPVEAGTWRVKFTAYVNASEMGPYVSNGNDAKGSLLNITRPGGRVDSLGFGTPRGVALAPNDPIGIPPLGIDYAGAAVESGAWKLNLCCLGTNVQVTVHVYAEYA